MPGIGVPKENIVIVSGIGCSSRFPYYMNVYGMHSIHGRATAIASGLKASRPELSVWVVTGDGDSLSIGGNHTIHLLRRNFDINILLFNNQIYGLTKGQYSPTSEEHKITKSTPYGSIDHPFNPLALASGADATFIARSMDRDPKHLQAMLTRSHQHKGASFLEIYQNCNIFNDGAFEIFTEKGSKPNEALFMEQGKPLILVQTRTKALSSTALNLLLLNSAMALVQKISGSMTKRLLQSTNTHPHVRRSKNRRTFPPARSVYFTRQKEPATKMLWLCRSKRRLQQKARAISISCFAATKFGKFNKQTDHIIKSPAMRGFLFYVTGCVSLCSIRCVAHFGLVNLCRHYIGMLPFVSYI